MGNVIRGEMFKLAYGPEVSEKTDPGTSLLTNVFGVIQSATLPDPNIDIEPIYALGSSSYRNWYTAYRKRVAITGSIPDIWLLNGNALAWPIGTCTTTGTDVTSGGGSTLASSASRGGTSVTLNDASDYAIADVIQIGTGSTAECRTITNVNSNTISFTLPLTFAHSSSETCNEVEAPFTHTISEAFDLKTFTLHATYFDNTGTVKLMRRFLGGKVDRATVSASEGDLLKISFDDIKFLDWLHNQSSETTSGKYSATVADITPSYPTTQPYLFSYGSLSLDGTTFARIRSFRLSIDNGVDPKYYINTTANSQLPYENREGKRRYGLSITTDIEDATLYNELMQQGTYSDVYKGFQVILTFTRGTNDTITITLPPSAPAEGGNAMGCLITRANHPIVSESLVGVDLDILTRSLSIVIEDSISDYPI